MAYLAPNLIISGVDDRIKVPADQVARKSILHDGGFIEIDMLKQKYRNITIIDFPITKSFHPLGFDILENKTIYVINHDYLKGEDFIEVFEIFGEQEIGLKYKKTITIEGYTLMSQLNSLAVLNNNTFYVTVAGTEPNYFKEKSMFEEYWENTKQLFTESTYLLQCSLLGNDNKGRKAQCKKVFSGNMMNGVSFNTEKTELFASDTIKGHLFQFDIAKDYSLVLKNSIYLNGFKPDNVVFDNQNKKIYLTGFHLADFMKITDQIKQGKYPMIPTAALELSHLNNEWKIRVLFMQNKHSGSSEIMRYNGNKLVFASWLDNKVMICPLVGYYGN